MQLVDVQNYGDQSGLMNFGEWTRMERWHSYWEMGGGYTNRVMEDVGVCVLYWLGR